MASAREPAAGPEQRDAADQNFDYMFKLLIIGNSSVGKTSFLFRYADNSFTSAFVSTVGIDFKVKTIYRNDKRIKLQIWVRWQYQYQFYGSMSLSGSSVQCLLICPTAFHSNSILYISLHSYCSCIFFLLVTIYSTLLLLVRC